MNIVEKYARLKPYMDIQVSVSGREEVRKRQAAVITEHLLEVYINERLTMKLTCTPSYLAELVLGRMLTEGMMETPADVDTIYICEHGRRAKVFLKGYEDRPEDIQERTYVEMTPSCCTGNHILNDYFVRPMRVTPVSPLNWKQEWIFRFLDAFEQDTPLHSKTGSTHSCYLMIDGEILFQCEDIGRHNALDKAIGFAIRHGLDLTRAMVYTTGRVPTDMVMKALRAKIPVLVSRRPPTTEALRLAADYGLTIIGEAKKDKMIFYNKNE